MEASHCGLAATSPIAVLDPQMDDSFQYNVLPSGRHIRLLEIHPRPELSEEEKPQIPGLFRYQACRFLSEDIPSRRSSRVQCLAVHLGKSNFCLREQRAGRRSREVVQRTKDDYLQVGDQVCVLAGASVPILLRAVDDGGSQDGPKKFRVVGETYVEALKEPLPLDGMLLF
jgi:hypothetical protein